MRFSRRDKGLLVVLLFFSLWIYLLYFKGVRFFLVPSRSMEPTLKPGDKVISFRAREIKRGDLVVFKNPLNKKEILVKRVIALPGETISIKGGKVFVNGKYLYEPYIKEPPSYYVTATKIPPNHYFVLGDNRNNSEDSSVYGPIPRDLIIGKDIFIYWPPSRWGKIK